MAVSGVMNDIVSDEFLRDIWYFALPSDKLKVGQLLPMTFLNEPVVLGRLSNGVAFALRDICPHRGIPLSDGRLVGDEVECCYHGWRFDSSGTCICIPSLTDDQEMELSRIKINEYPLYESAGCIWIFVPSDFRIQTKTEIKSVIPSQFARPAMVEKLIFPCHIDHAVIGLMDPAHGPFVHQSWWWRSRKSIHKKSKKFGPSELGFSMLRHTPSSNSLAYKILGAEITTEISFKLPGIRMEHIEAGRNTLIGLTTVTPLTSNSTMIWHMVYWSVPYLSLVRPVLRPFLKRFLRQDRDIVKKQQRGLKHNPDLLLVNDSDVQAKWYFRLKKAYAESKQNKEAFINPIKATTLEWRS